jgi:phosphonate transport system substrate-binding protein
MTGGSPLKIVAMALAAMTATGGSLAFGQDNPEPLRFLRPALEGQDAEASPPTLQSPAPAVEIPPASEPPAVGQPAGAPNSRGAAEETGAEPAEPAPVETDGAAAAATAVETSPAPDEPGSIEAAPAPGGEEPASIISLPGESEPIAAPLRFGIAAGGDLARTMAALRPLEAGLAAATGRAVEFLPMATYGAMIDAQVARRIDGGFYSAAAFAFAEAGCNCLEPLVAPAAADGTTAYHAVVVVRQFSPIRSPADLVGKIIATGPQDSIGARRMQLAGLAGEGLVESRISELRELGSAQQAVRLLLAGEVDAAFAWSSLAGDEAAGYSRGTFAELVAAGELDMNAIRIVWKSPPITHGPFAVASSLAAGMRQSIEDYFLALHESDPAAYDALNDIYGGGYRAVELADYAALAALTARPPEQAGSGGGDSDRGGDATR